MKKRYLFYVFFCLYSFCAGQKLRVNFRVVDEKKQGISEVALNIDKQYAASTDETGVVVLGLPKGEHVVVFSHPDFQQKRIKAIINRPSQNIIITLAKVSKIEEVVVTAKESRGLTSKSIITRKAMTHLQPSSFADLMELLPGGLSKDPNLLTRNRVLLRENDSKPSGYNTSSLGALFVIDGNVWNTHANLQTPVDDNQMLGIGARHNTTSIGVDMRTLSTNDIERVEIVRGIPSAQYGDLTSGIIKIKRKTGKTPLRGRFKADGFSKQYYVGKGFELSKSWHISAALDYLDAKRTPINEYENYQRVTASLRSKWQHNLWGNPFQWEANLDFSSNLDKKKFDPDTGYASIDAYKNSNRRISFTHNFSYHLDEQNFFSFLKLNAALRLGLQDTDQTKLVQLSGPRALSLAITQGENVGIFPDLRYVARSKTEGRPVDLYLFFKAEGRKNLGAFKTKYEAGIDWKFSKNYGRGQIWDMTTPPSFGLGMRPRAFKDIPAWSSAAAFVGNRLSYSLDNHELLLYTGLRFSKQLGLDKSYDLHHDIFIEPRINLQYRLPQIMIGGAPLQADITLGYGQFYKKPTLLMLFPTKRYWDYTQLSYFHNDERYRYVNFMTFVQNTENKALTAAKNIKHELRLDLNYKKHRLFITYFKEAMHNGFRQTLQTQVFSYKAYDSSAIDLEKWGPNGPDLSTVPYELIRDFGMYAITENGSETIKNGIEFGYSSPRIKGLSTRFTFTGAWFRTQYRNSVPVLEQPNISIGGATYPYYGIYQNDDGYINENLNYNLLIDTYLPNLGLTISASLQGTLYDFRKKDHRVAEPIAYIALDGKTYDFVDADRQDAYKQWLVRNVSVTDNMATRYTFTVRANLKVTKRIYKNIRTSMFVNRIFNYEHPYYFLGKKIIRKSGNSPYFGMEINFSL